MHFQHSSEIWSDHPELVAGAVVARGITGGASVGPRVARFNAIAEARLATASEAELPEIQAWRRAFSRMGLKPTQYRCASESLLRRFRKEGALPRIHPLIDLCNAISLAFAIPVAVFDVAEISGSLEVRHADGDESYLTFSGQTENPDVREVIFADAAGRAHARRWTNRQSGHSAVRETTTTVLVVAEAMHGSASVDVPKLTATVADELNAVWQVAPRTALLSPSSPRLEF
ncbi:B3/B4 domain-containing protein [Streptosporangium roseum]|uniref:Phosphoenolpyruvate synthase n=1 Tax=Streptosporangium roseum (strain ATCC 12428 / DSM 43021 / JCM 3005 / KCTC 9067 / NCIMB 10171 / NRRL 2505 / NI 9100) TaxID=479432 RepID=D2BDU6_STRRD|nr:phenylalanine--tRNA ligase beta subunit-related protein [Streptosporangium roseum]ACZ88188.1 phosphoenolpyruvate synthase [Streptosporangium roseum DSM 43021]